MSVSLVICSRNRCESLARTLKAISGARSDVPIADITVVDNGSNDATTEVVATAQTRERRIQYVLELQPGQTRARNAGVAASRGDVLLWTDDDVHVSDGWIDRMCGPILSGEADVTAGGIRIARHLKREWQTKAHDQWMAVYSGPAAGEAPILIGANMAFGRHVLQKVPAYDEELGPGALGYCDETLFAHQLRTAGYRIQFVPGTEVEHHFDEQRLLRSSWLKAARAYGGSNAYLFHHWEHGSLRWPRLQILKVMALRLKHRLQTGRPSSEGIHETEFGLLCYEHQLRGFLRERNRPRNYERHGLVKLKRTDAAA